MKNDISKTNYLAAATLSQYDALQRQVSSLTQHWMDHTSQIRPSKIVPELCNYIENAGFTYLKCKEEELFSTKSDFYLGKIISYFIEINDNSGEDLKKKRSELETVLNQFKLLNHAQSTLTKVNFNNINNGKTSSAQYQQSQDEAERSGISWWLKFLALFK